MKSRPWSLAVFRLEHFTRSNFLTISDDQNISKSPGSAVSVAPLSLRCPSCYPDLITHLHTSMHTNQEVPVATYLTKIGSWFYYFRRIPTHLKPYDGRKFVRVSLKTKDRKEAERRAAIHDDFTEKYWADLIRSGSGDCGHSRYRQVQQLARAHGFAYCNIAEVASLPAEEIVARVEALGASPSQMKEEALLGGETSPGVSLSGCLEIYWTLLEDRLTEKSGFQIRKYKVPRETALRAFIEVVGDKDLTLIDRKDVLTFRSVLMKRISRKTIVGNTANKQLTAVKDVLVTVGRELQLERDFVPLFTETKFVSRKQKRPPFEARYLQQTFLEGPALNRLNRDARLLFLIMMETGARPMEITGMLPEDYCLNDPIPHLWIRKNRLRALKVDSTERRIPLVGVALEAAREVASTGLVRYRRSSENASATINKFLRVNDLLSTPGQCLYSLRHTFKDRLRDVEAPEEIINELMGHRQPGPQYGRGRLLEQKKRWLEEIVFSYPETGGVIFDE